MSITDGVKTHQAEGLPTGNVPREESERCWGPQLLLDVRWRWGPADKRVQLTRAVAAEQRERKGHVIGRRRTQLAQNSALVGVAGHTTRRVGGHERVQGVRGVEVPKAQRQEVTVYGIRVWPIGVQHTEQGQVIQAQLTEWSPIGPVVTEHRVLSPSELEKVLVGGDRAAGSAIHLRPTP